MNYDKVLEILRGAKETAPTFDTRELVENFETFLELYREKDTILPQQPDYMGKLQESYKKLWEGFDKVANAHGIDIKKLKSYFENKGNFSHKQWQNMQAMKQEISTEETPKHEKMSFAPSLKKLRRTNKNVKV